MFTARMHALVYLFQGKTQKNMDLAIPWLLYQWHIYSFNHYRCGKNLRSSNTML